MYPACCEHRKAHVCPNSSGVPNRLAGISFFCVSVISLIDFLLFLAASSIPLLSLLVSIFPGSRLFIITLFLAYIGLTPARNDVSPALAPDDRSSPSRGIKTDIDVIFTILPNFRFAISSAVFCMSSMGVIIFCLTPSIIASLLSSL